MFTLTLTSLFPEKGLGRVGEGERATSHRISFVYFEFCAMWMCYLQISAQKNVNSEKDKAVTLHWETQDELMGISKYWCDSLVSRPARPGSPVLRNRMSLHRDCRGSSKSTAHYRASQCHPQYNWDSCEPPLWRQHLVMVATRHVHIAPLIQGIQKGQAYSWASKATPSKGEMFRDKEHEPMQAPTVP